MSIQKNRLLMEAQIKRLRGELNEGKFSGVLKKAIGQTVKSVSKQEDSEWGEGKGKAVITFESGKTLELYAVSAAVYETETYVNTNIDINKMKGKTISNFKEAKMRDKLSIIFSDGSKIKFKADSDAPTYTGGARFSYGFF